LIKKRFALFGGSFDPPHLGHKEIIKRVLKVSGVDMVLVVPTHLSPFKKSYFLPPEVRLRFVKSSFGDIDGVVVSGFEIEQNRAVFTVETIEALRSVYNYNIVSLIIGADNLKNIDRWRGFDKINSEMNWIVATRRGASLDNLKLLREYRVVEVEIPISSTQIRAKKGFQFVDSKILSELEKFIDEREKDGEMDLNLESKIDQIVKVLDDKKAEEIEVINLKNVDYIAQEVVIASSMGGKHTLALYDHLKKELKPLGVEFFGADESDEWVVVDMGEILVHIMTPAYRQKYSIEEFLSGLREKVSLS
jgi:nicotinate-nucleotide adenylyltransferase